VLLHTQLTGTPSATTIFSENFDGAATGALPTGWIAVHAAGARTTPWITRNDFCGATSNAAFHVNANVPATDPPTSSSQFERLFSPLITVPADAEYVTLDFDVCFDTEDDPADFNILAFDGFFLRITDRTPGNLVRSVLAEAFATQF